ncbi:MAG TPA: bacteriorhodopsin [Roseiarcus sp.]|nr:bacteriorhodopsin [Roseiarcus sp.]
MNASPLLPLDVASATFLLMTAAMAAAAVLLLTAGHWVSPRWRLPVALSSLVPLVGVLHYGISSLVWLQAHEMPVVFRYADWMIAAPIQVLTLYFLIQTVENTPTGLFWRLLVASVAMVLARYMGETDLLYPTLGFLIGLILWLYVLGELYFGRMAEINAQSASDPVRLGYFWLRLIVTVGWALYPLSYLIVRLGNGADVAKMSVIYNLADLINQIAFVLAVLATAINDSAHSR